jgi:hypothetical protein
MSNEMVATQRRRTTTGDFRPGAAAAAGVIAGKRAGDEGGRARGRSVYGSEIWTRLT